MTSVDPYLDYDYEDTPRCWGNELIDEIAKEEYYGRNR